MPVARETKTYGCGRAEVNGVVPRQFRNWLRQLLQPAVVGEAAVEDRRVGAKINFQVIRALTQLEPFAPIGPKCQVNRSRLRVRGEAVVQGRMPPAFEIARERAKQSLRVPIGANAVGFCGCRIEQTAPIGTNQVVTG